MRELPPLSLYVHLPWCVRKCPYCDFNSHAAPERLPRDEYVAALLQDLDQDAELANERPLISIFFGGGTPSLFAPEHIYRILQGVRARMSFTDDVEITLEANPGTIERGRFEAYRAAGVNRVSLGAQSFNARHLQQLGRIHDEQQIVGAVEELNAAGIDNFNLDLMYGLPEQTVEEALRDLDAALALRPTHLSHYQLTLEPGTVFYHRPPPLPDADVIWEMQERCQAQLARAGYPQYEVSAYAPVERRCKHNLNYWSFGDYLGIGAGAHGKLSTLDGRVWRTVRPKQPRTYLESAPEARFSRTEVDRRDLPFEFMLNQLRLRAPLELERFAARTGLAADALICHLQRAERRGLMRCESSSAWTVTELGWRFLNDLQALFLPADPDFGVAPSRRGAPEILS